MALELAVAGCAHRPAAPVSRVAVPLDEAEALIDELRADAAGIVRYQGILRIFGRGPEGSFDAKLVVIFRRPDAFRVELLGPLGRTQWAAVSEGPSITVWFPRRGQVLKEKRVEEVVARLIGIRMTIPEVMNLLGGTGLDLTNDEVRAAHRVGSRFELGLGAERQLVISEDGQVVQASSPRYRVDYPNPWKERRRHFPRRLRVANDRLEATLTTEGVDVNLPLHEEAFVLDVPDEAEPLRLGSLDDEAVFVPAAKPRAR